MIGCSDFQMHILRTVEIMTKIHDPFSKHLISSLNAISFVFALFSV